MQRNAQRSMRGVRISRLLWCKRVSERKTKTGWEYQVYYDKLLSFADDLPTKVPPDEAAVDDGQLYELMVALRASNLEDNDVPLFTLFRTRGFGVVETHFLISLMVRRKKGRGRPAKNSILKLQAQGLRDIKTQLRAHGIRSRIHERAMRGLEEAHNLSCGTALAEWGLNFAAFDRDRLENYIRRSRVRRTNSRAK